MTEHGERRKSPRKASYLPVQIRFVASSQIIETLAKDVGLGGARCVVAGTPAIGQQVMVDVPLYRAGQRIRTHATIIWVQPVPEANQAVVGLRFEPLPEEELGQLAMYVRRNASTMQAPSN